MHLFLELQLWKLQILKAETVPITALFFLFYVTCLKVNPKCHWSFVKELRGKIFFFNATSFRINLCILSIYDYDYVYLWLCLSMTMSIYVLSIYDYVYLCPVHLWLCLSMSCLSMSCLSMSCLSMSCICLVYLCLCLCLVYLCLCLVYLCLYLVYFERKRKIRECRVYFREFFTGATENLIKSR